MLVTGSVLLTFLTEVIKEDEQSDKNTQLFSLGYAYEYQDSDYKTVGK